jgi:hypothetical protein
MTPSSLSNRGYRSASNFLAARDSVSTTLLCYAKITPAALHCGKIDERRGEGAEAAGGEPEFEVSDFAHGIDGLAPPFAEGSGWHRLKQSVHDA